MPNSIKTPPIYQNPYMAPNGFSGIHLNAYMTDTGSVKGPAFASAQSVQQKLITPPGIAATIAFTAQGQLVTIHIGSPDATDGAPTIMLIDPTTLDILDRVLLPQRPPNTSGKISFAGGYFYLDQHSNVVCVTADQKIQIYSISNNKFVQGDVHSLFRVIAYGDVLNSVLPDSLGNIWYISNQGGVGYVEKTTQTTYGNNVRNALGANPNETITKSFASDGKGGVYLVTDYALYCYKASAGGPTCIWRTSYERGAIMKPGQNQIGSGTTPTCFDDSQGNRFVAITDNAIHMHVNVYWRDTGKLAAQQTVFTLQGPQNACENSLIAVDRSIIVENNYGNSDIDSTAGAKTTTPGVRRLVFDPSTGKSSTYWANDVIAVPSVVSQVSTGDGMMYTYAKDANGWYWAALDYETGNLVNYSPYIEFTDPGAPEEASNNYYAGLTIGPTGAAYLSVFGGLTVWRPGLDAGSSTIKIAFLARLQTDCSRAPALEVSPARFGDPRFPHSSSTSETNPNLGITMSDNQKTAQDFVNAWADLLERAQKDPALKKRLLASPLDELTAEGFAIDSEAGKAIEQAVRAAVDNPNMVDILRLLASGGLGDQTTSNPDYIRAEAKWHGVLLTLSSQACTDLANGMGIGAAISAALAFIPAIGPALAFVIIVGITVSAQIINLANRGKGVWVTYLWIPPHASWVHPVS